MEFTVKLDRFEGPYTKLLELIDARKLSITEISLVSVADDYIAYIKTLDQKNIIDISQFIVVASTLMLMKVKSLLPGVIYTQEEEKQVHDLEFKLELYAFLANASEKIKMLYGKKMLHSRPHRHYKEITIFVPDERVTPVFLQSIVSLTLLSFVSPKALVKVAVEQALRIETVIEKLLDRVKSAQSISLQSLAGDATSKEEQKKVLIVNFIALLELLRTGTIQADQHIDGGDIIIGQLGEVASVVKEPQQELTFSAVSVEPQEDLVSPQNLSSHVEEVSQEVFESRKSQEVVTSEVSVGENIQNKDILGPASEDSSQQEASAPVVQ